MVALPRHPADRDIHIMVEEETHLPGRGQQLPGLFNVG